MYNKDFIYWFRLALVALILLTGSLTTGIAVWRLDLDIQAAVAPVVHTDSWWDKQPHAEYTYKAVALEASEQMNLVGVLKRFPNDEAAKVGKADGNCTAYDTTTNRRWLRVYCPETDVTGWIKLVVKYDGGIQDYAWVARPLAKPVTIMPVNADEPAWIKLWDTPKNNRGLIISYADPAQACKAWETSVDSEAATFVRVTCPEGAGWTSPVYVAVTQ